MKGIEANDPMFPVAGVTTVGLPGPQAVLIRFDFLTNAMQSAAEPNLGRNYVLNVVPARALARRIVELCDLVEGLPAGAGEPQH